MYQPHSDALVHLNELSSFLWRTDELEEGLKHALKVTIDLLGADKGNIQLLADGSETLQIAVQIGFPREFLETFREVAATEDSACGRALRLSERIVVADIEAEPSFAPYRALAERSGFKSVQSTPLVGRDGARLGMISTHWAAVHRPPELELVILDLCARQLSDFIERCRADELLRETERASRHLAAIVESSEDAIVSKDLNGVILSWNAGAERLFGYTAAEAIGQSITIVIPSDRLDEEPVILSRIRRGEKIEHFETVRRRKDGTLVDISLTLSPVKDRQGRIRGVSKIARDISESVRAKSHRELLLRELDHRTKNTLAKVISIARQTFSDKVSMREARDSFERRLQAVAKAHDRLSADRSGTALGQIVEEELAPHRNAENSNIRVSGPHVILNPRCALAIAMAVHELATNAAKYGALSLAEGSLQIEWQVDVRHDSLALRWIESGGPPVAPRKKQGFGSFLIERALATELIGEVEMIFAPGGLQCVIRFPLARNALGAAEPLNEIRSGSSERATVSARLEHSWGQTPPKPA